MRMMTIETDCSNPQLTRIKYEDGSIYHGQIDKAMAKNGIGRYYGKNGQILEAGEWRDDEFFRTMTDEQIENIFNTLR